MTDIRKQVQRQVVLSRIPLGVAAVVLGLSLTAGAGEWPGWRGPAQNASSSEQGLVSSWSPDGTEGLVWKSTFTARSTPVVLNGRVYVIGRGGEGITEQEIVACFDAGSG